MFIDFCVAKSSSKISASKMGIPSSEDRREAVQYHYYCKCGCALAYLFSVCKKRAVPTTLQFAKNPLVVLKGSTKEVGQLEKKFDNNFGAVIGSFGGKVQFIQAVTLKVNTKTKLTGTIEYMVCNEERCLPPTKQSFEVDIQ